MWVQDFKVAGRRRSSSQLPYRTVIMTYSMTA